MGNDFIVTAHALERMEQRFRDLCAGLSDQEVGELVHREVMCALDEGRSAKLAPLELAPYGPRRWIAQTKGGCFVWNEDKKRGYALREAEEGLLVTTVLIGRDTAAIRSKVLRGNWK